MLFITGVSFAKNNLKIDFYETGGLILEAESRHLPRILRILGLRAINAPARASLFYTLGGLLSRGAAFLLTPILTRLLSAEDFGAYSLFNAALSALTVFGTLDICGSIFFRGMQKFERDRARLIRSALILISICSCLAFLLFAVFFGVFSEGEIFPFALPLLFISLLSNGAVNLYSSACKFSSKFSFPLCASVILGVLSPAVACGAAVAFSESSADALLIKVFISTAFCALTAIPLFFYIFSGRAARTFSKGEKSEGAPAHIKYLLGLALPMLPYYISLSVMAQGDKLIISRALGDGALGAYSVAVSAGSALTMVTAGITTALTPWIMRKTRQGDFEKIRRVLHRGIAVISPAVLCFLCAAPELFSFLAPREYLSGLSSVYPIALGGIPILLSGLINAAALTYEKPMPIILSAALPSALSIGANLLLTEKLGIAASGIISYLSHLLMLLICAVSFKKISGKSILNVKSYLHLTVFCAFFALSVYLLRESLPARIFFGALALATTVITMLKGRELLRER